MSRYYTRRSFLVLTGAMAFAAGCTDSTLRLQSPEALDAALEDVRLVRDVSVPFGGHAMEVEAVVLIGNLPGTGSDPPPSSERSVLVAEMQKRDVERPNEILSSPSTSLAIARARLRPGIQKGDRFDVDVFVPSRNQTTSLRDGMMYEVRLRENAVLGGRLHQGPVFGLAKGPVLVDPMATEESNAAELRRGKILGGGIATEDRPLGLMLKPDAKDVRTSAQIGAAINRRFYLTSHGIKSGVANPKTEAYVDLKMHPRYKDNVERYLRVVLSIPLKEGAADELVRMQLLEQQLLDPVSAASAAIRLEAIGEDGEKVLKKGIASANPEVRFYAAEALAYLDDPDAAAPLGTAARDEPAFRANALAALSAMDDPAARDELAKLLDVNSAETRYGAFRALWAMNPRDPLIRGEVMDGQFSLHVVHSEGPPMVHVTRSFRPEVVLFGSDQKLRTPLILDAGKNVHINATPDGKVQVSRITPGQPDRNKETTPNIDDVIRAIVEVGGSYPDVVQALAQAKSADALACRFEVDAVPARNRRYHGSHVEVAGGADDDAASGVPVDSPKSDLYPSSHDDTDSGQSQPAADEKAEKSAASHRWPAPLQLGRIFGWRRTSSE